VLTRQTVSHTEVFQIDRRAGDGVVRDRLVLVEEVGGESRTVVPAIGLGPDRELVLGVLGEARVGEKDLQELQTKGYGSATEFRLGYM
jgi:hypothetical protein